MKRSSKANVLLAVSLTAILARFWTRTSQPADQNQPVRLCGPAVGVAEYQRWAVERAWSHTGTVQSWGLFGYEVKKIEVQAAPDPAPPRRWLNICAPRSFPFRLTEVHVTVTQWTLFDPVDDRDQEFDHIAYLLRLELERGAALHVTWSMPGDFPDAEWRMEHNDLTRGWTQKAPSKRKRHDRLKELDDMTGPRLVLPGY